ncbi:MAG: ribosome silencing factor [Myxococcota bacterium]
MAAKKKKPARKASAKTKKTAARKPSKGGSTLKGRPLRRTKRPSAKVKRPARGAKKPAAKLKENPGALALARDIAQVALEKKALDVLIIDTRARGSSVGYDYIVLATGESDRQLSAISEGLKETLKPRGHRPTSVEASPDWVLVNYDDVVAHFFTEDKRGLYDLEGLWSDAPRVALH